MRPNQQETDNLAKFTEEILNGKLHFLCSDKKKMISKVFTFDLNFAFYPSTRSTYDY